MLKQSLKALIKVFYTSFLFEFKGLPIEFLAKGEPFMEIEYQKQEGTDFY